MKRNKKNLIHYITISALLLTLHPGGNAYAAEGTGEPQSPTGQPTELSIMYSGADVTWVAGMEELCEEFMEQNPDVIIHTENSAGATCENELKVKEALNEFPDIFELEDVKPFREAGKVGEIGEKVSRMVSDPVVYEDKVYGLPVYATTNGIIYNKNIFKKYGLEIPEDYEGFLKLCDTLRDKGVTPLALGGSQEEEMLYWLNYFFQKDVISGTPDWLEQRTAGKVSFSDPEFLEALRDYQELLGRDYFLEDSAYMTENQLVVKMVDNQFAMVYAGPWLFSKIIDAYPMSVELDRTELGEEIAQEDDPVTYRIGWFFLGDDRGKSVVLTENKAYWSVSADCMKDAKKKEAAEEFLTFFYTKKNYRSIIQGMYGLPVTTEAIIYPAHSAQQKLLKDYRYADKSTVYLGSTGAKGEFLEDTNTILGGLYRGEYGVEKAAEAMDEAWSRAMEVE